MHLLDVKNVIADKVLLVAFMILSFLMLKSQWWDNTLPPGFKIQDANGWEVMKYSHMDGFYIIGIIIVCICIIGDAIRSNWFFAIGSLIGYLILSLSIIYPLHLRDSIFDVEFGNFTQWYYRAIVIHIVEVILLIVNFVYRTYKMKAKSGRMFR